MWQTQMTFRTGQFESQTIGKISLAENVSGDGCGRSLPIEKQTPLSPLLLLHAQVAQEGANQFALERLIVFGQEVLQRSQVGGHYNDFK
jgi:hypothetical protein